MTWSIAQTCEKGGPREREREGAWGGREIDGENEKVGGKGRCFVNRARRATCQHRALILTKGLNARRGRPGMLNSSAVRLGSSRRYLSNPGGDAPRDKERAGVGVVFHELALLRVRRRVVRRSLARF